MWPDSNTAPMSGAHASPLSAEEFWPDEMDEDFPDDPVEPEKDSLEDATCEELERFRRTEPEDLTSWR
jgi:hypothetical protein